MALSPLFSPPGAPRTTGTAAPRLPFGPPATASSNPFSAQRLSAVGFKEFDEQAKAEADYDNDLMRQESARQRYVIQQQNQQAAQVKAQQTAADKAAKAAEVERQKSLSLEVTRANLALSQIPTPLTTAQRAKIEKDAAQKEAGLGRTAAAALAASVRENPKINETDDGSILPNFMDPWAKPTPDAQALQDKANNLENPEYKPTSQDLEEFRKVKPEAFAEVDSLKTALEADNAAREARRTADTQLARAKAIKAGMAPEEADAMLASAPKAETAMQAESLVVKQHETNAARTQADIDKINARAQELAAEAQAGVSADRVASLNAERQQIAVDLELKAGSLKAEQDKAAAAKAALETRRKAALETSIKPKTAVVPVESAMKAAKALPDGSFETPAVENLEALAENGKKVYWTDPKQDPAKAPTPEVRAAKTAEANERIKTITETSKKISDDVAAIQKRIQERSDLTPEKAQAEYSAALDSYEEQHKTQQAELSTHLNDAMRDFREGSIDADTLNAIYHAANQPETGVEAFKEHKAELDKQDEHVEALKKMLLGPDGTGKDDPTFSGKLMGLTDKIASAQAAAENYLRRDESGRRFEPGRFGPQDVTESYDRLGKAAQAEAEAAGAELAKLREERRAKMAAELTKRGVDVGEQAGLIARAELETPAPRVGFATALEAKGGGVKGVATAVAEKVPFAGGFFEVARVAPYVGLVSKLEGGKELSPAELDSLTEFVRYSQREGTGWLKLAEGVATSLSFGAEIAGTAGSGGAGGAVVAAKKGAVEATKAAIKWALTKEGLAKLVKAKTEALLKGQINGGVVAKAIAAKTLNALAVQTPKFVLGTGASKTLAHYVNDAATQGIGVTEQEGKIIAALDRDGTLTGEARHSGGRMVADALFSQAKEFGTEKFGAALPLVGKVLGRSAPKAAAAWSALTAGTKAKLSTLAMVRALQKLNPSQQAGKIGQFLRAASRQGLGTEILEERVGDVADAAYGFMQDGRWDLKLPTGEDFLVELGTLIIPGAAGAIGNMRAESKLNKALETSDTESAAHLGSVYADTAGTAARLSDATGEAIAPEEVAAASKLIGAIEKADSIKEGDQRQINLLAKAEEASQRGDMQKAFRLKQMALQQSRQRGEMADREVLRGVNAARQIADIHDQANKMEESAANEADPDIADSIRESAATARMMAARASGMVKIARGLDAELNSAELEALKAKKDKKTNPDGPAIGKDNLLLQPAIDRLKRIAPAAAEFISSEQDTLARRAKVTQQTGAAPATSATPSAQPPAPAAGNAAPGGFGGSFPPGAANPPSPSTGKMWRVTGNAGTVVEIPQAEAATEADARAMAVKKGSPYQLPGVERAQYVEPVEAPSPSGTAKPAVNDGKPGATVNPPVNQPPAQTGAAPADNAGQPVNPPVNRREAIARHVEAAIEGKKGIFTGGIELVSDLGRRAALLSEEGKPRLAIDIGRFDAETKDLEGDALKQEVEKVIQEEWIHAGTVLVRTSKQAAKFWNSLTPELQKGTEDSYTYGTGFKDMNDAAKGYEAYRMFTQWAIDGKITENTNIPASIADEIKAFLREFGQWLTKQLSGLPKAQRDSIKRDIRAIKKALGILEAKTSKAKTSNPAKGATKGGADSGTDASTGTTETGASPPASAAGESVPQGTRNATDEAIAEMVAVNAISGSDESKPGKSVAAMHAFWDSLQDGDTVEWTDGAGRLNTAVVEVVGKRKTKFVVSTTKGPSRGYEYGRDATPFIQYADTVKVTPKATPVDQAAHEAATSPQSNNDLASKNAPAVAANNNPLLLEAGEISALEGFVNGVVSDPEAFRNSSEGKAILTKLRRLIKRPAKASEQMNLDMLPLGQQLKIVDGVVESIPVFVVDYLMGGKLSAKGFLHNDTVFKPLPADAIDNDANKPVTGIMARESPDVSAAAWSAHNPNNDTDSSNGKDVFGDPIPEAARPLIDSGWRFDWPMMDGSFVMSIKDGDGRKFKMFKANGDPVYKDFSTEKRRVAPVKQATADKVAETITPEPSPAPETTKEDTTDETSQKGQRQGRKEGLLEAPGAEGATPPAAVRLKTGSLVKVTNLVKNKNGSLRGYEVVLPRGDKKRVSIKQVSEVFSEMPFLYTLKKGDRIEWDEGGKTMSGTVPYGGVGQKTSIDVAGGAFTQTAVEEYVSVDTDDGRKSHSVTAAMNPRLAAAPVIADRADKTEFELQQKWWNYGLTHAGRAEVLKTAGFPTTIAKIHWQHLTDEVRAGVDYRRTSEYRAPAETPPQTVKPEQSKQDEHPRLTKLKEIAAEAKGKTKIRLDSAIEAFHDNPNWARSSVVDAYSKADKDSPKSVADSLRFLIGEWPVVETVLSDTDINAGDWVEWENNRGVVTAVWKVGRIAPGVTGTPKLEYAVDAITGHPYTIEESRIRKIEKPPLLDQLKLKLAVQKNRNNGVVDDRLMQQIRELEEQQATPAKPAATAPVVDAAYQEAQDEMRAALGGLFATSRPVDPVLAANRTARAAGAVGAKAITPRYVAETTKAGESVLNFGAGKPGSDGVYLHSEMVRGKGGNVSEYDFGQNETGALGKTYDTVFASNVLNVQADEKMLRGTLRQIFNSTKDKGRAVFNYPVSPRYLDMTPNEVAVVIESIFGDKPRRVGGTKQAPLWEIGENRLALASSNRPLVVEQLPVPEERTEGILKASRAVIKAGIRTPEALAKFLDDTFPGGRVRAYAESIWDIMGIVDKSLRGTHDWTAVYNSLDQASEWAEFDITEPLPGEFKPLSRDDMPQVPIAERDALLSYLHGLGIDPRAETVSASTLKPAQREYSTIKVARSRQHTQKRAIIVSSDNFIVDGHHQYVAADGGAVPVLRLNVGIEEAINAVRAFPGAVAKKKDGTVYETEEYQYLGEAKEDWRKSDDPEAAIVNPIDPDLSPDEKVDALRKLSNENIPVIEAIIADLSKNEGLKGKYSRKNADRIQAKASRPSIRAKSPWHDVEHIRDGLRFKVVLDHFDKIEAITETLHKHGVKVIKFDHKKMFAPKEWGWRFVAWDIQMPNGQLVEFYAPLPALSRKEVKHTNHLLFEKWRNLSADDIRANPSTLDAYTADVDESAARYGAAFAEDLKRMGYADEAAALASWNNFVARAESLIREKSSINSAAEAKPGLQTPEADLRNDSPPAQTTISPLSDSDALAASSFSTLEDTTGQQQDQEVWRSVGQQEANVLHGAQVRDRETGKPLGKLGRVKQTMGGIIAAVSNPKGRRRLDSLEILIPSTTIQHENPPTRRGGGSRPATPDGLRAGNDQSPAGETREAGDGAKGASSKGAGAGSERAGQSAGVGRGDGGNRSGNGTAGDAGAVRPGRAEEVRGGAESNIAGVRGQPPIVPTPEKPEDRNHRIDAGEKVAPRSVNAKIDANFKAIELLRTLEKEERNPNAEERAILEQYTGWGFIKEAFNTVRRARYDKLKDQMERYYRDDWEDHVVEDEDKEVVSWYHRYASIQDRLKAAFGEKEFLQAEKSVRNAHYTTPTVLGGMWDAVKRLGFRGGKAVEPGGGAGHAIGTIPDDLANRTRWEAVELDGITARLLAKLYPQARVNGESAKPGREVRGQGFQDARIPNNSVDLFFSNVPFAKEGPGKSRSEFGIQFNLHNYFFARALAKTKPGGIIAFITSANTMESSRDQRAWLSQRSEFVGAIRLPNTAFKENAGTEVVTDIIFLRKPDGTNPLGAAETWLDTTEVGQGPVVHKRLTIPRGYRKEAEPLHEWFSRAGNDWIPEDENLREAWEKWRGRGKPKSGEAWKELMAAANDHLGDSSKMTFLAPIRVNEYFARHPEMVLGTHALAGSMYRPGEYTVLPKDGDLGEQMAAAIKNLPENIAGNAGMNATDEVEAESGAREFSYVERDGVVYQNTKDGMEPVEWRELPGMRKGEQTAARTKLKKFRHFAKVRGILERLITAEANPAATDEELAPLRAELNAAYDAAFADYGGFSKAKRNPWNFLEDDPDYYNVQALDSETITTNDKGETISSFTKSDIFKKRLIPPYEPPTSAKSLEEAVSVSMAWEGRLNAKYVGDLLGITEDAARKQLLEEGLGYDNPATGMIETEDEYLSGAVGQKLKQATEAAIDDPKYNANVAALRAALPARKPISQASVSAGQRWIPDSIYNAFARSLGFEDVDVSFNRTLNRYEVKGRHVDKAWSVNAEWGPVEILEAILNHRTLNVTRYDSVAKKRVRDTDLTALLEGKAREMKDAFVSYVKSSQDTVPDPNNPSAMLPVSVVAEEEFNDKVNSIVPPTYKGDWITLPNAAVGADGKPIIWLKPFRKAVLARFITEGRGMMAHGVGSGKTYNQIALAMELRRLGKARKPLMVVQGSTINQVAASFKKAYPNAKILVASPRSYSGAARKRFTARIATGDWDAVIMTHANIGMIPNKQSAIESYYAGELDELNRALESVEKRSDAESDLLAARDKLMENRAKVINQMAEYQDNSLTWEDLGIDALIVDEAHAFKNAPVVTMRGREVKNIPTTGAGALKAVSMMMKTASVRERGKGKGVFFATGTPVSNTMAEAFIMMRYIAPDILASNNIYNFDDFANQYGDVKTTPEATWNGTVKSVDRFAKFINGGPLVNMIRSVFDVALGNENLGINVPDVKGGKPRSVIVEPSEGNQIFNDWILAEVGPAWKQITREDIENNPQLSAVPIMTMQAGIAAALDPRMIHDHAPDDPNSKVNSAIREVLRIHKEGEKHRTAQVIFADLFNPFNMRILEDFAGNPFGHLGENPVRKGAKRDKETGEFPRGNFNLGDDIKTKLVKAGVPANEVYVVTNESDEKLTAILDKVNSGEIRVVIGSTQKLGVGVNMQERLAAAHHLMPPRDFKPAMMEQRNGRIIRQGNLHADWRDLIFVDTVEKLGKTKFDSTDENGNPITADKLAKTAREWLKENDKEGKIEARAKKAGQKFDVEIIEYSVGKSLDSAIYSMMAAKAGMIGQVLSGHAIADEFDDPTDELAFNFAENAANIIGDANLIRFVTLDRQSNDLRALYNGWRSRKSQLEADERNYAYRIAAQKDKLKEYEGYAARLDGIWEENEGNPVWTLGDSFTVDTSKTGKDDPKITATAERWLEQEESARDAAEQTSRMANCTVNGRKFTISFEGVNGQGEITGRIGFGHKDFNTPFAGAKSFLASVHSITREIARSPGEVKSDIEWSENALEQTSKALKADKGFPDLEKLRAMEAERDSLRGHIDKATNAAVEAAAARRDALQGGKAVKRGKGGRAIALAPDMLLDVERRKRGMFRQRDKLRDIIDAADKRIADVKAKTTAANDKLIKLVREKADDADITAAEKARDAFNNRLEQLQKIQTAARSKLHEIETVAKGYTGRLSASARPMADDMREQEKWLDEQARKNGFADVDQLAQSSDPGDVALLERLAAKWRNRNNVALGSSIRPSDKIAQPEDARNYTAFWIDRSGTAFQVMDHLAGARAAQQTSDEWDSRKVWGYEDMWKRGFARVAIEPGDVRVQSGEGNTTTGSQNKWLKDAAAALERKYDKPYRVMKGMNMLSSSNRLAAKNANEPSPGGLSEADAEYLAVANAGDLEEAERMVHRAARAVGYDLSHRRGDKPFELSEDVVLFTDWSNERRGEDNLQYGARNYIISSRSLPEIPWWVALWARRKLDRQVRRDREEMLRHGYSRDRIRELEKDSLRKTLSPEDIVDSASFWDTRQNVADFWMENEGRLLKEGIFGFKTSDGAVIFDPITANELGLVKLADPIIRDAKGAVVPLSERFANPKARTPAVSSEGSGSLSKQVSSSFQSTPEGDSAISPQTPPSVNENLNPTGAEGRALLGVNNRLGVDDPTLGPALDELTPLPAAESERINKLAGFDYELLTQDQAAQAAAIKREGVKQFWSETRDRETHRAWNQWARDTFNKDPEAAITRIVYEARNGFTGHSGQQAKLAMLVLEHLSAKAAFSGDAQMMRDVEAITLAFDLRSTLAGREIAARWQPHATMEEQHRTTIAKAIYGPTAETRAKLDAAMSRASKNARIAELEAQVAELLAKAQKRMAKPAKTADDKAAHKADVAKISKLRADLKAAQEAKTEAEIMAKQNKARLEEVQKAFEAAGFTLEEVMVDRAARLKLQGSGMVKRVLEAFNPRERIAIRAIMEGKSDRVASTESGVSRSKIGELEARFDAALDREVDHWIDRGFSPADMDRPDFAEFMDAKGGLFSPMRPTLTPEERTKLRQSWKNTIHPPAQVRNNPARKKFKPSKAGGKAGIDIGKPEHAIVALRAIQRAENNAFDMVYEYWINGILSGPATHVANIAGNTANVILEYGMRAFVEAPMNVVFRDMKGATFSEFNTMRKWALGAAVAALQQARTAWNYEVSSFDWDATGEQPRLDSLSKDQKTGYLNRTAIGGRVKIPFTEKSIPLNGLGRLVRAPSRALLFMDEFTKYFVGVIEASAQAHRIAKADGLTGEALDDRVAELVRIPGSPAWVLALEKAHEMTFQQDLPKLLADAQNWLNKKTTSKTTNAVRWALKFIFPFIKTPYNILAVGLRKTPLGTLNIARKAVSGAYKGNGAAFQHDLAEQVLAWFAMTVVAGMAEGDPDDDKKTWLITGTRGRDDRSEASLLNRSKGGETTILYKGKPIFNYGRYAPLATSLATVVNAFREMKKVPHGKSKIAAMSSMFADFVNTARSQTFLQGIDGLANFMASLSRESEGTEVQKMAKFLAQGVMPNLVRQPLRNADDLVRDTKNAPWYYHMVPVGDIAEPLYDLYGLPIRKGGSALSRLLISEPTAVPAVAPGDKLLNRWNTLHPVSGEGDNTSYFPSDLTKSAFRFKDAAGKWQDMTPAEIREVRRRVGQQIGAEAASIGALPIQENIDALKKARGSALEKVKKEMFPGGSRPAVKAAPSLWDLLIKPKK